MKKLVLLAVVVLAMAFPDRITGLIGLGASSWGIGASDPLGTPQRIHDKLMGAGFSADFGAVNKPRTIVYTNSGDEKLYQGFPGAIKIVVGDEEYVQQITGTFLSTQHGPSPQRMTPTEGMMVTLWNSVGGPKKPKFERSTQNVLTVPKSVKFGKVVINQTTSTAKFNAGDVQGTWAFSEDELMELIDLKLK